MSSADNVLEMSVMRGLSGVEGLCEMRMCFTLGGVVGEGVFLFILSFRNKKINVFFFFIFHSTSTPNAT